MDSPDTTPAATFFMRGRFQFRTAYSPNGVSSPTFLISPCSRCFAYVERYSPESITVAVCVVSSSALPSASSDTRSNNSLYRQTVTAIVDIIPSSVTLLTIEGSAAIFASKEWLTAFPAPSFKPEIFPCVWFKETGVDSAPPLDLAVDLSTLRTSDVPLVAKHWPYVEDTGPSFLHRVVERLPSACVRPNASADSLVSEPVGWVLCYPGGSLGSLHVLDDWQRRGIAASLVAAQSRNMRRAAAGKLTVNAVVLENNAPSRALFGSLPSWKQSEESINWITFTKTN